MDNQIERITHLSYRGKAIMAINYSGLSNQNELRALIRQAGRCIAKQPPNSLLTLTDFSGVPFDLDIVTLIIDYAKHNKPYIQWSALVGIEGYANLIFHSATKICRRENVQTFVSRDIALDWLVRQGTS